MKEKFTHKLILDLGYKLPNTTSTKKRKYGIYSCSSCGANVERRQDNIVRYRTIACELCKHWVKHSSVPDLASKWQSMLQRCFNPNIKNYINYGARGIKVCKKWKKSYIDFETWALNNGYEKGLTIDRIDNDGNYKPSNCRFTTMSVQTINKRHVVGISGVKGVTYHNQNKSWTARISIDGVSVHSNGHATIESAKRAYDVLSKRREDAS